MRFFHKPIGIASHILFAGGMMGLSIGTCLTIKHKRILEGEQDIQKRWLFNLYPSPTQDSSLIKLEKDSFFSRLQFIVSKNLGNLKEEEKVVWALIALNSLVFAAWQLPSLRVQKFMNKWFVHMPIANRPVTLITSVFSHQNTLHFGANMLALYSFFPSFRKSNISTEQVLSLYLSAGIFSSLISHLSSYFIPGRAIVGGLGASGAIYSLLMGTGLTNPTGRVGIIFLPGVSFELQDAIPVILLFDLAGVILRWKAFDHIAHLSGAFYCWMWYKW